MGTEKFLLICAAISGWLIGALGWFKWWHEIRQDRVNLKIEASMPVKSDQRGLRAYIEISAVNNGRRPAKIKAVHVLLSKEHQPIPMNLNPEQREQYLRSMQRAECSSTLSKANYLEIAADGGSYQWELPLLPRTKFLTKKRGTENCGQGYIEFTSGKEQWFYFEIMSDEHLQELLNPPRP